MATDASNKIRDWVRKRYVDPARTARQRRFSVRCGDVEKELGLFHRTPQVCSALRSGKKFLVPNGLRLVETSGPPSGVSTTTTFIYEFEDLGPETKTQATAPGLTVFDKLLQMKGILKDVYKELGGAEKAIREEREGYER